MAELSWAQENYILLSLQEIFLQDIEATLALFAVYVRSVPAASLLCSVSPHLNYARCVRYLAPSPPSHCRWSHARAPHLTLYFLFVAGKMPIFAADKGTDEGRQPESAATNDFARYWERVHDTCRGSAIPSIAAAGSGSTPRCPKNSAWYMPAEERQSPYPRYLLPTPTL